jgi:murein peptide amidase A
VTRLYGELERRWKMLRTASGVRVRETACVGAPRTLLCVEIGDASQPVITLAAGAHGDEPAGPWALLDLVENSALDTRFAYRIWPCMNPTGYDAQTRESADGLDINRTFGRGGISPEARAIVTANRDRHFMLSIDLHEDCDADGFYCYAYRAIELGHAATDAVGTAGFPLASEPVVAPNLQAEAEAIGGLSFSLAMVRRAAACALTLETPSAAGWDRRIAMHRTAVCAAIAAK